MPDQSIACQIIKHRDNSSSAFHDEQSLLHLIRPLRSWFEPKRSLIVGIPSIDMTTSLACNPAHRQPVAVPARGSVASCNMCCTSTYDVRRRPSLVGLDELDASFCIARSRSEICSASGFPDLMQQTADVVPKWWLNDFFAYAKAMIVATFVVMSRNCYAGRPWQGSSKLAKVESSSRQVPKLCRIATGLLR